MGWKFCFSKRAHPIETLELPSTATLTPPRIFSSQPISEAPKEISSTATTSIFLDPDQVIKATATPKEANISTVLLVDELAKLKQEGGDNNDNNDIKPEPRRLASLSLTTSNHPIPPRLIELVPPTPIEPPLSSINNNTYFSNLSSATKESTEEENLPLSTTSDPSIHTRPDPPFAQTRNDSLTAPSISSSYYRQHRRSSSGGSAHKFKETLNAFEQDAGEGGERTINQYILKGVIGHGSYATVERATDRETGIDYAVKEFSKAKLRRRAASEMIRGNVKAPGMRGRRPVKVEPLPINPDKLGPDNLSLIRSEVAIMKKVNHPNICVINEVIDVTSSDSLIVVMELCEGGPISHVSLEKEWDAYSEEKCRSIFIQLLLGLSYLHHNSIVHRDIKPDNCLFMKDMETVKIVDFGVSEMFIQSEVGDLVKKSVGSPAFMAPELCATKHGHLHGFACDIWSLGATLFTLACGRVPFAKDNLLDLVASISDDPVVIPTTLSPSLQHLLSRLLEKDAHKRITMLELWVDPWVTCDGILPMVDYETNCANPILEPTYDEVESALRSLRSSVLVAKIASKFVRGMHRRSTSGASEGTTSTSTSTFPLHSPSLFTGSPLSSPQLIATPFSSKPINFTGMIAGMRETPLRKETVSSISTFDSIESVKIDRSESPGSSVGILMGDNQVLYMADPEEEQKIGKLM